jgi:enoyl-CoA hydratase/carnithine racemase
MTAVVVETPAPAVALVRLNRPERLNALNHELVGELRSALAAIAVDADVRVVVLTGAGRGFCAGLDLQGFGPGQPTPSTPTAETLRFQEMMASLPIALRELPQPVIAAINGPAAGGGFALALGADIRVCGTSASFGNAAIRIGLSGAEMGMSYHLPRIVGPSVAADWMLTGRIVRADEAFRCGLVSALVEDDALLPHALELAAQISEHTPLGVQLTKRAIQTNLDAPDLRAALEVENRNQILSFATPEAKAARERWATAKRG